MINDTTLYPLTYIINAPVDAPKGHSFLSFRLTEAFLITLFFAFLAVGYVEVSYRVLLHHYRNGKLARYFPLPTDREYTSNTINALAFIGPSVALYYFYLNPTINSESRWLSPSKAMSFKFNPIEIIIYLVAYMLMQHLFAELISCLENSDTMFYQMHTHAHSNKWVYKVTHALHHEYTHEMNLFTTAYAEAFENFYQTGTPWAMWTALSYHNFWLLNLPLYLNLTTTILGHSGFKSHPCFVQLNPLLYVVTKIFGVHLLTPSDHQVHHSQRRFNFGLYFRWQDKWHGTYQRAKTPSYKIDYWMKALKSGEYQAHGKAAAIDGKHQKVQLQFEETSWGF
ncbi:hypothetical protein BU17DRAFT_61899 [Hysterangium stoloniferum]|nr:hypothetical protein BU17DRAFT_61899 [Hysterangium stoloniferum]